MLSKGAPEKLKRKPYEKELRKLQEELCHLQDWLRNSGERVIVVLEGRDAAGKGGTVKAITDRVSPRVFRVVALPAPSDREKSQKYLQRYVESFAAGGEIVIFDRSWYNRAGVEYVMGFCSPKEHKRFLELCPVVEKFIIDGGARLIKIWLEVGQEEQDKRSHPVADPLQKGRSRQGEAAGPVGEESVRRSGVDRRPSTGGATVLSCNSTQPEREKPPVASPTSMFYARNIGPEGARPLLRRLDPSQCTRLLGQVSKRLHICG